MSLADNVFTVNLVNGRQPGDDNVPDNNIKWKLNASPYYELDRQEEWFGSAVYQWMLFDRRPR